MKISKNQLKSMIMEELQAVLSEQESFPPQSYTPFISPQDIIATARGQEPTASVPSLGTSSGPASPRALGTSSGTSTPIEYNSAVDNIKFVSFDDLPRGSRGVVSPIPSAAQAAPAATPKVYSGGYSYERDDAGGFKVTKDGKAAGYAKPGSPEAQSIAAEIGGGVYDSKQQRFMQRRSAEDVTPGVDVSDGFSLNPAAATPKAVAFVDDMLKNPAGTTYRGPRRNVVRSLMNDPGVVDQDGLSSNRISQRQAARKFVRDYSKRDPDAAPFGRFGRSVFVPSPARRDIEEMIYEALLEEFGNK